MLHNLWDLPCRQGIEPATLLLVVRGHPLYFMCKLVVGIVLCTSLHIKRDNIKATREFTTMFILPTMLLYPAFVSQVASLEQASPTGQEKSWGYEYVLQNGDRIEIGDSSTPDFKPHLKLNRWGGECFIALEPAGLVEEEVEHTVEGDKVKCKYKVKQGIFEFEWESEFYPLEPNSQYELGGFEFEVILKEKPLTNKIVFDIETQGLEFYYQPELTQEEILAGAIRPDNVVGSYAVYHTTRTNMHTSKEDAEKYKCGIAFHWYRPLIWDSSNPRKEVWGELTVDTTKGIRTVTIPQEFLDSAVYPVTVDDTFGYTEAGASQTPIEDKIKGSGGIPSAGTGDTIHAYLYSGSGAHKAKAALYDADGNGPIDNGTCPEISLSYVAEWFTFTFSASPSLSAVLYHIPVWGKEAAGTLYIYYNSPLPAEYYCAEDIAYNGWPESIGIATSIGYSTYCTYTLGEAPPDAPTNFVASDNLNDKVTCTWTKSAGATKYQVYRDGNPIGGELGDVDTFDDTTATAPIITPGTTVATDGSQTAHIALSLSGTSLNDGTTYSYTVRAGNDDGWSSDSNADNGHREPGALTYQWQRSAGDSDDTYGDIGGATSSIYNDVAAPAGTISNAGTVTASDGTETLHVVLSLADEATTDGAGRYYKCVLAATGAAGQTSASNRGYRGVGTITYQWQRSSGDADEDYSNVDGATTDPYNDIDAPANGDGRWYLCLLDATGAVQEESTHDRGYRATISPGNGPSDNVASSLAGTVLPILLISLGIIFSLAVIVQSPSIASLIIVFVIYIIVVSGITSIQAGIP